MSRTTDFSIVQGLARIDWTLKTETPVCIRSGTISALNEVHGTKSKKIDFMDKARSNNGEGSVSDFYFDIRFSGSLEVVFRIPASSIRGALRNYTIKRLVEKSYRGAMLTAAKRDSSDADENTADEKQYIKDVKDALKDPGWHLIQNLFGLAMDSGDKDLEKESVAGRLRVVSDHAICPVSQLNSTGAPFSFATRSPLDRASRGTKEGGLHSFMELKSGFEFNVSLQITNPTPLDLGFIAFWEKSINQGMIRMGGLGGIGRGKLRVKEAKATLFTRDAGLFISPGEKIAADGKADDILDDIYPRTQLPWTLKSDGYLQQLKDKYESLKGEASNGR